MIKGTTKMMCLLGKPVDHSLSPALHNELCRLNNIDGFYAAFCPELKALEDAIKGIKALGGVGFNVTYPYKEAVIPFLDEVTEDAKLLNAVNTVVLKNGKLIGHNTDVFGVEQLMLRNHVNIKDKLVCILGTGGASRAVAVALSKLGVKQIDFYSRNIKENFFLDDLKQHLHVRNLTYGDFESQKKMYDVVINGTPLGMGDNINKRAINPCDLKLSMVVIDLIYSPSETNLLTFARKQGYNVVNGYDMLYYQGLKAFSLWTDVYLDHYDKIKQVLL